MAAGGGMAAGAIVQIKKVSLAKVAASSVVVNSLIKWICCTPRINSSVVVLHGYKTTFPFCVCVCVSGTLIMNSNLAVKLFGYFLSLY